jgi:hypothetical protein
MKPLILNADYMIPSEEIPETSREVELHFTRFGNNKFPGGEPNFQNQNAYKVFCHVNEPTTCRWTEPVQNIIKHHKAYDRIVTSNMEVLRHCVNSTFMVYGTTWLNKSKHHPDAFGRYDETMSNFPKELSISMICNNLQGKPGYEIRRTVYANQHKINIEKKFYSSTRFPIPGIPLLPNDDKINLFNSMYSVVIESSKEENYFTEKLIDCLITKTIPVYWGCPNISDFFDTSYWIKMEDVLENKYTEEHYFTNMEKINQNCKKAIPYSENLFGRIFKLLNVEKMT